MLTDTQLKQLYDFHTMIIQAMEMHENSLWLDEDFCETLFHTYHRLHEVLRDMESLHEVPILESNN